MITESDKSQRRGKVIVLNLEDAYKLIQGSVKTFLSLMHTPDLVLDKETDQFLCVSL